VVQVGGARVRVREQSAERLCIGMYAFVSLRACSCHNHARRARLAATHSHEYTPVAAAAAVTAAHFPVCNHLRALAVLYRSPEVELHAEAAKCSGGTLPHGRRRRRKQRDEKWNAAG
jgi:hypothetical protein